MDDQPGLSDQYRMASPWPIFVALGIPLAELGILFDVFVVAVGGLLLFCGSVTGLLREAGYAKTTWRPLAVFALLLFVVGGVLAFLVMPWYVFFLYPSYVGIETGILTADMTTPLGLYLPMAVIGLFAAGVVFYTGWPILRGAYVSLRTGRPNMDLLVAVAVLAAYAYSTVALAAGSTHLYYDVAVAIVLVVTAGTHYEGSLKRAATARLTELASARGSEAVRRRPDGTTESVDVGDLEPGETVVVRPGERVPVDGTVVDGVAAVDEAVLTGESLPATRGPGDRVVGGSVRGVLAATGIDVGVGVGGGPLRRPERIRLLGDRQLVGAYDRGASVGLGVILHAGSVVVYLRCVVGVGSRSRSGLRS